jgi:heme-degrading monooxygenase HmoA
MIVRIRFVQTSSDFKNRFNYWDNKIAPTLKKQKGFCRAFRCLNQNDGEGIVIEFWENSELEEAWRQSEECKEIEQNRPFKETSLLVDRCFDDVVESK